LVITLAAGGVTAAHAADAVHETSLVTSGDLVVISDNGDDLVRESAHDEAQPLSTEPDYAVVTQAGDVIPIEGDSLEGAASGDSFSGVLTVPTDVTAELGIAQGATIDADSVQGADVIDLVDQSQPLTVQEATVQPAAVSGASVSAPHSFDIAIVDPPNAAAPTTTNSAMDGLLAEVGPYWVRETNNAISSLTRSTGIARYQSSINCASGADNSIWSEAAARFGRTTSSYFSGAGRHLVVILPQECLASMGVGLGSVGSMHSGGLVRVVEYKDTLKPTLAHELGHNLGLGHSNVDYCHGAASESTSCTEYSYSDAYSVMGYAWVGYPALPALPAPMRDTLGAYAPGTEMDLPGYEDSRGGTYTLKPATDSAGLRSIRIDDPLSDLEYFVEYRTGGGADAGAVYTRNNRTCQDSTCTEGWGAGSGVRILVRNISDGSSRSVVYTHYLDPTNSKWGSPVLTGSSSFTSPSGGVVVRRGAGDAAGVAVSVALGGSTVTGPTTLSSPLVRTADSLQIWLLSNGTKFPINNLDIYRSLAPLGGVATVSTTYLDTLQTGAEASRFIGDSSGNLYYLDAGSRYHFDSCERVADFGFSCQNWTPIETRLVDLLIPRGELTNVVRDAAQHYWLVNDGTRRQAVDAVALQGIGAAEAATSMSTSALLHLPVRAPILRDDVIAREAGTSNFWLNSAGSLKSMPADVYAQTPIASIVPTFNLTPESSAQITSTGSVGGIVTDGGYVSYLLTEGGKARLGDGVSFGIAATTVSASILGQIPTITGTIIDPAYWRSIGTQTVFLVSSTSRRTISSWEDFSQAVATTSNDAVYAVPASTVAAVRDGGQYARPGSIVRSGAEVYLVDGNSRLVYISSFDVASQLGLGTSARVVSDMTVASMSKSSTPLQRLVTCNGSSYFGVDGVLLQASSSVQSTYGVTVATALDPVTCRSFKVGAKPLTGFVRDSTGAVFVVIDGARRYVASFEILQSLGGSASVITDMRDSTLRAIPAGLPLVSTNSTRGPAFVRGSGRGEVYFVGSDGKRARLMSWTDYLAAAKTTTDAKIYVLPASVVDDIPLGPAYLRVGTVVKTSQSPELFMLDGTAGRIPVGNMETLAALGLGGYRTVPAADIASYVSRAATALKPAVTCSGTTWLGLGGKLYALTGSEAAAYGTVASTSVDGATCAQLPLTGSEVTRFLRGPDGRIWMMEAGTVRHIQSMATLEARGGTSTTIVSVSQYSINQFPVGLPLR